MNAALIDSGLIDALLNKQLLEHFYTIRNHLYHLLHEPIITDDESFEHKVKKQISIIEVSINTLLGTTLQK